MIFGGSRIDFHHMAGRKPTVTDAEILGIFRETSDPVLTTVEVAETLDFSQPGILKRLKQLESDGCLSRKKAGNSHVWWLTDEGREYLTEANQ